MVKGIPTTDMTMTRTISVKNQNRAVVVVDIHKTFLNNAVKASINFFKLITHHIFNSCLSIGIQELLVTHKQVWSETFYIRIL